MFSKKEFAIVSIVKLNDSNTDGSFSVPDSNVFESVPQEILPIAQETYIWGYFREIFWFTHENWGDSNE